MASADRLIEVFDEAKTRPAGADRDHFLSEACQADPELKEQVLSLLQANEGAGDFLKYTQAIPPVTVLTEKPGDKIGRYKLLQKIGEGGCGVVYAAEQEEPVRRRVALKVIKLGMDTKQVIARFEAERQALAMMDHPNIAKVLDGGATDTGRPYFVMELVRGIKITDYCDQHNLSTSDRLKLFIQICQAVQHAHQKGIIHRDIKPSNILVTQHDDVAMPKVIDFGIAKATIGPLTEKTLFTAFAQFMGTPAYMSPEQAQMSGLDVDTRADIYSLGVLLYELLTGNTPFDAKELLAAGMDEMRRKIREDEPAKPSTCLSTMQAMDLTTVAKHRHTDAPKLMHLIRGDLDWLVMKCLEKDRTRRYETANALAMDLQRHLNDDPVVARPPSAGYRFQKLLHRNKLIFAAVSAVTAALIIGLGFSTWLFLKEREARQRAVAAEKIQRRVQQEAKLSELKVVAKNLLFSNKLDAAEASYRQALPIQRELSGNENSNVVRLLDTLAGLLQIQGKRDESEAAYREALSIQRKLSGDNHPDVVIFLFKLAESFWKVGEFGKAESTCREAIAIQRTLTTNAEPIATAALGSLIHALDRRKSGQTNTVRRIPMWGELTDQEGDCTVTAENGKLSVEVPGTVHDLSPYFPPWLATAAPRILREVEGDFIAQVKVTGEFDPGGEAALFGERALNGAGLLLWDGDKNYLRLEQDVWKSSDGVLHSDNPLFVYWKDNRSVIPGGGGGAVPWIKGRGIYFQITRAQNNVTAAFSYDGVLWMKVRSEEVRFPTKIRVGVAAINTSKKTFKVEFSEFKVTATEPVN